MFNEYLQKSRNVPRNSFIITGESPNEYLELSNKSIDELFVGSGMTYGSSVCSYSTDNWMTQPTGFMTPEEIRQDLEQFESKYGISSSEFYKKWKKRDVDDIPDSIEWSIMYRTLMNYFKDDV